MLNFLSQKNRKPIIYEYLYRIAVCFLTFVFLSAVLLIILFVPSFFFAKYKSDTIKTQFESIQQKNIDQKTDPTKLIRDVNKLSIIFSNEAGSQVTSGDIIAKIISLKNKNIKISSMTITEKDDGGREISLAGTANTRDDLTTFAGNIKTDGFFKSLTFPLSDFIKSVNSEFTATLTL